MTVVAMFTRRVRRWGLGTALVLLAIGVGLWLLMPPRTDCRILVGMTRVEVEAIMGSSGTLFVSSAWVVEYAYYDCPDGSMYVNYKTDQTVRKIYFTPRPMLERFRAWFRW